MERRWQVVPINIQNRRREETTLLSVNGTAFPEISSVFPIRKNQWFVNSQNWDHPETSKLTESFLSDLWGQQKSQNCFFSSKNAEIWQYFVAFPRTGIATFPGIRVATSFFSRSSANGVVGNHDNVLRWQWFQRISFIISLTLTCFRRIHYTRSGSHQIRRYIEEILPSALQQFPLWYMHKDQQNKLTN